MAKFSKWLSWQGMARDLSRSLYSLNTNENFAAEDLRWHSYSPNIFADTNNTGSRINIFQAAYATVGTIVHVGVWGEMKMADHEPVGEYMYVSLPFPYDLAFEGTPKFNVRTVGTFSSGGPNSVLASGQWLQFWQTDGSNIIRPKRNEVIEFAFSGTYARTVGTQFSTVPTTPDSASLDVGGGAVDGSSSYTPTLSATTMTFGSVSVNAAIYKRVPPFVMLHLAVSFVPGGTVQDYVECTLPIDHFGTYHGAASGFIANTTAGTSRLCPARFDSGSDSKVIFYHGPGPTYANLVSGESYRLEANLFYRSVYG